MVFSSHLFLFYLLALSLAVYYLLPLRGKHLSLTLFSYLFYGWANPLFIPLLLGSTTFDFICGLVISGQWRKSGPIRPLPEGGPRTRLQRGAMIASVCSNLLLLGFFKYFNFGVENYDALVRALGMGSWALDVAFRVTLPLGISFMAFQSLSYAVDVYRGHATAMRNFLDYACFASMFPQLVAGPIVRFEELDDQLRRRTHTLEKFARGVSFLALGLGKKILLANPCGKVADTAFDAASVSFLDAWTGVVAYAFQIYYDFSAYSDMAIGLGLMTGFMFAKNFDSPYKAQSITEFWRRWHLSLSHFLRDYLYVPLGGNQRGPNRTLVNLMTVMVLGGLWHGASWNFVIWGAIHGVMLVAERLAGKNSLYRFLPKPGRVALTFAIVCFAWVFFRAPDLPTAWRYCGSLVGAAHLHEGAMLVRGLIHQPYYLLTLAAAGAIAWFAPQVWDWTKRITWPKAVAIAAVFWAAVVMLTTQAFNPFIYFIF